MKSELCVPAAALTKFGGDGSDSGTAPGVGDEVEMTVKGRVTRLEGGNTYVQPESVNDEPIAEDSESDMSEPDQDDSGSMKMAVMAEREKGAMP